MNRIWLNGLYWVGSLDEAFSFSFVHPKENETKEKGATNKGHFPRETLKPAPQGLPARNPQMPRAIRGRPPAG